MWYRFICAVTNLFTSILPNLRHEPQSDPVGDEEKAEIKHGADQLSTVCLSWEKILASLLRRESENINAECFEFIFNLFVSKCRKIFPPATEDDENELDEALVEFWELAMLGVTCFHVPKALEFQGLDFVRKARSGMEFLHDLAMHRTNVVCVNGDMMSPATEYNKLTKYIKEIDDSMYWDCNEVNWPFRIGCGNVDPCVPFEHWWWFDKTDVTSYPGVCE